MFPLSWPAFLFQSWINTISLVFPRSLPESDTDKILLPPIFSLLRSPKTGQKMIGAATSMKPNVVCTEQQGSSCWIPFVHHSVQCGIICKSYLKNKFNETCSEEKIQLFSFIVRWESLDRKAVNSWIMVFAPKHDSFLFTQNFTWQFKMVLKRLQTHFSILFCTWCWKITIKPVRQPILKYCRMLGQDFPSS